VDALVEKVRGRIGELAKARHIDVVFESNALLVADPRGDLLPALFDPQARGGSTARVASVDLRRALVSCREGRRAQARLAANTEKAERELDQALRTRGSAFAMGAQHALDDEERSETRRVADALRSELTDLARGLGIDIVRDVAVAGHDWDVIYGGGTHADLRGEDLTASLITRYDAKHP